MNGINFVKNFEIVYIDHVASVASRSSKQAVVGVGVGVEVRKSKSNSKSKSKSKAKSQVAINYLDTLASILSTIAFNGAMANDSG